MSIETLASVLWLVLYSVIATAVVSYVAFYLWALLVALFSYFYADPLTVDPKDPESPRSKRAILRELGPFDLLMVALGGRFWFPLYQTSAERMTVRGYRDGRGLHENNVMDWQLVTVPQDKEIPPVIQSSWGILDPVFVLRRLLYKLTGRHLIRLWFPFIVTGVTEILKPWPGEHVRGRPKGMTVGPHMIVIEPNQDDDAIIKMVLDTTDHRLRQFELRFLTASFPLTEGGVSLRLDVTLLLETVNMHRAFTWRKWSEAIISQASTPIGDWVRKRSIDTGYAQKNNGNSDGPDTSLQDAIKKSLADDIFSDGEVLLVDSEGNEQVVFKKGPNDGISLLERLGYRLLRINLNDILPASKVDEEAIVRITGITAEGLRKAIVSGQFTREQVSALDEADAAVRDAIAAITAANKAGTVDYINVQGQGQGPSDPVTMNYARRTADNTGSSEKE